MYVWIDEKNDKMRCY